MSKNLVYVSIAVLAVIAIVLGYQIYQQQRLTAPSSSTPLPVTTQDQQPDFNRQSYPLIGNFPGNNTSDEERKKFSDAVRAQAKESDMLDITGCKANPLVYKIKLGSDFKIKNSDTVEHKLYIGGAEKYKIPANTTITVKANFEPGPGTYGYSCDETNKNEVGLFLITE